MPFIKMVGKHKNAHIGDKTFYSHKINNVEKKIEIMRYAESSES